MMKSKAALLASAMAFVFCAASVGTALADETMSEKAQTTSENAKKDMNKSVRKGKKHWRKKTGQNNAGKDIGDSVNNAKDDVGTKANEIKRKAD